MSKIEVWTAGVEDENGLFVSVHVCEADAVQSVLDNYDPEGEFAFGGTPPKRRELQAVIDSQGLAVAIESHILELEGLTVKIAEGDDA